MGYISFFLLFLLYIKLQQQQKQDSIFYKNDYKLPTFTKQNEVHFWRPQQTNGEFSNFFSSNFNLNGKTWPTAEHYFQAQKFAGTEKEEIIRLLETPGETFKLGRKKDKKNPIRSDWEQIKEQIMEECCYAKFTQNEHLKYFLLNTGNSKLIEASPRDAYWGWGKDKTGKNRLGFILMKLRDQLEKQTAFINDNNEVIIGNENQKHHQFLNTYPCKFISDEKEWSSVEHFIQAYKFQGTELEEQVRLLKTPQEAIQFAQDHKNQQIQYQENQFKYKIFLACIAKFYQNQDLYELMLSTKNAKFVIQSQNQDKIQYQNLLQKVLQDVRQDIIDNKDIMFYF